MADNTKSPDDRPQDRPPEKARILDIGAGDPEAPANAIPNIIAHLVETETWRNAATVITGLLLVALGYWAYHGVHRSIAETRLTSLEALLGTVVKGLDVWVGEHRAEADRLASDPDVIASAARLAAEAISNPAGIVAGKCTAEANELSRHLQSMLSTQGVVGFRIVERNGLVLASRDPQRCGQRLRSGAFRQRLDLAIDGAPQFVRLFPDVELSYSVPGECVGRWHGSSRRSASKTGRRSPRSRWAWSPIASSQRSSPPRARHDGRSVRVLRRRPDADAIALRRRSHRGGSAARGRPQHGARAYPCARSRRRSAESATRRRWKPRRAR